MPTIENIGPYTDDLGNVIIGSPKTVRNSRVVFSGRNCRLELGDDVELFGATIMFDADGGMCSIGDRSEYRGIIRLGLGCAVTIGSDQRVTDHCHISAAERTEVVIGNDCLFAYGVEIFSHDFHPVFDRRTGLRANKSRSVHIGNHVWIAARAAVLSGAKVGDGCVLGYGSITKGTIPANSVAVGNPAKMVKSDTVWKKIHLTMRPPYEFPSIPPEIAEPATEGDGSMSRLWNKLRAVLLPT